MGAVMSFLFHNPCVDLNDTPAAPEAMPEEDHRPLVCALIQTIIYEKGHYEEPRLSDPEYVTKYLLKNYKDVTTQDLNARYEHSDKALFLKRQLEDSKNGLDRSDSFSLSFTCVKQTLLTLAARYSSPVVFAALLSHPDIDPNATDDAGDAPLHIAAKLRRADIVTCLVNDPRTDKLKEDAQGRTPRRLSITQRIDNILAEALARDAAVASGPSRP